MNSTSHNNRQVLIKQLARSYDEVTATALIELLDTTLALDDFKILGDCSLYQEACMIHRIFDAVTSGSSSPSLLSRLNDIDDHSVFINWKYLILAINLLYQQCYTEALQMVRNCTVASPQSKFTSVFEKFIKDDIKLSSNQQLLYDQLTLENPLIADVAFSLEHTAHQKDEILFISKVEYYSNKLAILEPKLLKTILLYSIEIAYQYRWQIEPYHQLISQLYSKQEAYRVMSLTSLSFSPLTALENYIELLKIIFHHKNNAFTVKESLKILGEIAILVIECGHSEEDFTTPWRRLQILFYQQQNYFHLYWPQEELIVTEALTLAEIKQSFFSTMMQNNKKQMELFT